MTRIFFISIIHINEFIYSIKNSNFAKCSTLWSAFQDAAYLHGIF